MSVARRLSLRESVSNLKATGTIVAMPTTAERVLPRDMEQIAYRRPCFICQKTGNCEHREPDVEAAIMAAAASAAERWLKSR